MSLSRLTIICALLAYGYSQLNTTNEKSENEVLLCLSKVGHVIESRTFVIIGISPLPNSILHVFSNWTLVLYNNSNLLKAKDLCQYNMFVIILNTISQFEGVLRDLSTLPFWNPAGKYLFAYLGQDDDIGSLFNISASYSIININIITETEEDVYIYTTHPFDYTHCYQTGIYKILTSCQKDISNLFLDRVPLNLHGCEVRVMACMIQPYVMDYNRDRDVPATAGIEVTLLHTLAERMNFTASYMPNPYPHWGYRFPDGRYSMMYQELIDGHVDMIFGFTYGNASYTLDFDASFSHLSDSSVWYFPSAIPVAQWKNLTLIFEKQLWILIFLMTLVNGVASWILNKSDEQDFVESIMLSLYTLLQGSIKYPSGWKGRLVFVLWLVTCLLLFTAHQCQLVSILTTPLYEMQMSTLGELVESGSEFGFYPTIADAYTMENTTSNVAIIKRFQSCPLTVECLNKTAFRRHYAVVKNRRQVEFLKPRYYTFSNGRSMLYDTNIVAFTTRIMFYTRKAFPILPRLNKLVMLMESNGLVAKWDADIRFFVIKLQDDNKKEPLSLTHLQGAFFVYGFGVILAVCTFITEIILKYVYSFL